MNKTPLALLLLSGLGAACGPSFQRVYDGDVKFEHCYATDENDSVTPEAKRACWHDWRANYTYGQSRDRVEYAATRYSTLSHGERTGTESQQLVATATQVRTIAAPVPTSAFAPPPNMMPANEASAVAAPGREAPGAECSTICLSSWQGCRESCKEKGCDACDKKYGACVPSCFRDAGKHGK